MTRRAFSAVAVSCLVLLSACNLSRSSDQTAPRNTGGSYGSGIDVGTDGERTATPQQAAQRGGSGNDGAGAASSAPHTIEPISPAGGSGGRLVARDRSATGANALIYLREEFPKLTVEINAVSGQQPTPAALETLKTRLASVLKKPQGIEFLPVKTFTSSKSSYTMSDVEALEARHRRQWSNDDRAVIHVLYLNGGFSGGNALGIAYRASSIVVFPERIENSVSPVVGRASIERAVLVHEFGHLLGLVNIGYKSPRDHEDPEHRGHSSNRNSVMFWAVEDISVANVLEGGPPSDFDADDRGDLADRAAGRL